MDKLKEQLRQLAGKIPIDKIAGFPAYQRWIAIVLTGVIFFALYFFLVHQKKTEELTGLNSNLSSLEQEVRKLKRTNKRLPEFEKKVKQMERELVRARERLPNEKEIPQLLEDVSQIGRNLGLEFLTFNPKGETPEQYYTKVPVAIKLEGSFHDMLKFFHMVSRLPRIVTIGDINFSSAKEIGKKTVLTMTGTATTFTYLDKPPEDKKKKRKKK